MKMESDGKVNGLENVINAKSCGGEIE